VQILASVPMNVEGGSYMTFGGPVGLFCVVAAILWVLFARPHRRVPPRRGLAGTPASPAGGTMAAASGGPGVQATSAPEGGPGNVSAAAPSATGRSTAPGPASADGATQAEENIPTDGTEASE
jgi:hypothetical protein